MTKTIDRWKAVRRGARYCAPACGRGCTWAEYQSAKKDGAALALRLNETSGLKGWKPNVWENLGWHWSAISACGRLKVHQHGTHSFTAFLGAPGPGGRWSVHGKTPSAAARAVIAFAREDLAAIGATIAGLP